MSATHPHAKLHKWHNALFFHWVQEVIASKYIIKMMQLPSTDTPANILSKNWA
jgi:hypothetical protein